MSSMLSLEQTLGGQRRSPPRVGEWFSSVACPEAAEINCPGNEVARDNATDTVSVLGAQSQLGLGAYEIPLLPSGTF